MHRESWQKASCTKDHLQAHAGTPECYGSRLCRASGLLQRTCLHSLPLHGQCAACNKAGTVCLTLYSLRAFLGSVLVAGSLTGLRDVASLGATAIAAPCKLHALLLSQLPHTKKV